MRTLIAIAALLASVSASGSDVLGKSIICVHNEGDQGYEQTTVSFNQYRGFKFVRKNL